MTSYTPNPWDHSSRFFMARLRQDVARLCVFFALGCVALPLLTCIWTSAVFGACVSVLFGISLASSMMWFIDILTRASAHIWHTHLNPYRRRTLRRAAHAQAGALTSVEALSTSGRLCVSADTQRVGGLESTHP